MSPEAVLLLTLPRCTGALIVLYQKKSKTQLMTVLLFHCVHSDVYVVCIYACVGVFLCSACVFVLDERGQARTERLHKSTHLRAQKCPAANII